jgi:hypothetical protein
VFKSVGIGCLGLLLAACGAPKPRPALNLPQAVPGEAGHAYRIDSSRSELRVLVYRAGALAHLGHNHVMVNRNISGSVDLADPAGASTFHLNVPAGDFLVDDAQARREEGADFAAAVPEDARAGTLRNMLSAAVLNAEQFPVISISSAPPRDTLKDARPAGLTASVAISVAGHESTLKVPLTLVSEAHQISASGTLELRQSALGLTPYSLLLGALQVQDSLTIKFTLVATDGALATVTKIAVPSGASNATAG